MNSFKIFIFVAAEGIFAAIDEIIFSVSEYIKSRLVVFPRLLKINPSRHTYFMKADNPLPVIMSGV